jgi:hypothetical protein
MMSYKLKIILTLIATILFTVFGAIFKIMHWPFSSAMMLLGLLGQIFLIITFILFLVKRSRRKTINNSHTN